MGTTKNFMSQAQRELANQVLDSLVPGRDDLPGAGAIGVTDYLDRAGGGSLPLRRTLTDLLAAIETTSLSKFTGTFSDLNGDQRTAVLQQVEADHGPLFTELLRRTYAGYYSDPVVLSALGIDARPPQPRGYTLTPFDPAVLEGVRNRDRIYRDA